MSKIVVAIVGVPLALLLAVGVIASGGDGPDSVAVGPVNAAAASIPQVFLSAYQLGASACPGLPWQVLAGAFTTAPAAAKIAYRGAPYGVGYHVGIWRP